MTHTRGSLPHGIATGSAAEHRKVAVTVISDYGDQVVEVFDVPVEVPQA